MKTKFSKGTFVPAIRVKILHPTNSHGTRIKATTEGGSVTRGVDYQYYSTDERQILPVVMELMDKLGITGTFTGGWDGEEFVFVKDIGPKVTR